MTKRDGDHRCEWCRRPLAVQALGRPRRFCGQGHRQRAYEARRMAEPLGLRPGQAVVPAEALRRLGDLLYALEAAAEDVERDLADDPDAHAAALEHLMTAAQPLRGVRIEPRAVAE